ncbi:MAG TPA: sugar ABC transporter permease [bacterium]|nr:sugar ABC transporter permease [bacterium]
MTTSTVSPVKLRRARGRAFFDALHGYVFIGPQLLGFFAFVLGPLVAVFVFSFQDRDLLTGAVAFVGLKNYREIFADPLFYKVLSNSLVFTAGLVVLNITLALTLALLLSGSFRGVTPFRTVFFASVVTSAIAWAIVWRFILQGQQGVLNQFLAIVGIHGPNWLREPGWAMVSVIVTRVLKNVGLNMTIYLAALKSIPHEYSEAARVDGASGGQVLRSITLPLLASTTLFVAIITVNGALQVFDHILLMTAGGPENATNVLVYYIYRQAFQFFQIGYASALAVLLFFVALGLTMGQWLLRGRSADA